MAHKPAPSATPVLSRKDVDAALKQNDFLKATELAKALAESTPTDLNRKLYAETLGAAFQGYTAAGKVKAVVETLKIAATYAVANPVVAEDIAILHAKAGEFPKALQLSNTTRVQNHIADLCVRRGKAEGLGQDYKTGLASILKAFQLYEASNDDASREATQAIGLTSPYLQWRVLLRGLTAYSTGDSPRAIENWQRLIPEFLPAKLAATIRVKIDPAFRASLPAGAQAELQAKPDGLPANDLTRNLKSIQKYTSGDQSLRAVWKHVTAVISTLKTPYPKLFERLGLILYHAIIRQGQPSDMKQFQNIFGPPTDDPKFYKLEALVYESGRRLQMSIKLWELYEAWLATSPSSWPANVRDRARAVILHRIGTQYESLEENDDEDDDEFEDEYEDDYRPSVLDRLFGRYAPVEVEEKQPKPKNPLADPARYYSRSIALAPNWSDPVNELIARHLEANQPELAAKLAEEYLKQQPHDLPMLELLSRIYFKQRKLTEHLVTMKRAQAINPLDEQLNANLSTAYCVSIRERLFAGDLPGCERQIAEASDFCTGRSPATFGALRVVLARKAGRGAEADAIEATLLDPKSERFLVACFHLSVTGLLAKLKPAVRKVADERLKVALETAVPHPDQVTFLAGAWSGLDIEGLDYRGKPTHEKKILALIERSLNADASDESFEKLLDFVTTRGHFKLLLKIAKKLQQRFPKNPLFYIAEVQTLILKPDGGRIDHYRVSRILMTAQNLAQTSTVPRHKDSTELIHELQKQFESLMFGPSLFRR